MQFAKPVGSGAGEGWGHVCQACDESMGISAGSTTARERGGELASSPGNKTPTALQVVQPDLGWRGRGPPWQKREGGEICGAFERQVFTGVPSQYPEGHRHCPPADSHGRQWFLPWESSFYGISTNWFIELVKCLIPVGIMRREASNLFRCLSRSPSSPPSSLWAWIPHSSSPAWWDDFSKSHKPSSFIVVLSLRVQYSFYHLYFFFFFFLTRAFVLTCLHRVISRAQGLKLVVETLMSSLKPIGNIVVICCAFFIIFGILGVQVSPLEASALNPKASWAPGGYLYQWACYEPFCNRTMGCFAFLGNGPCT